MFHTQDRGQKEISYSPFETPDCQIFQDMEGQPTYRYVDPRILPKKEGASDGSDPSQPLSTILSALEQQNSLLAELLASVSGLTAACLFRNGLEARPFRETP